MDLISVIIPVYKVEKTLERCVVSVINQSYRNVEIILVDDNSPDSSGFLCDEIKSKYKQHNIKVIHKKINQGLGMARNTGLDHVSGDYVYFLDSDDEIKKDTLLTIYSSIKDQNADICLGSFERVKFNSVSKEITHLNKKKFLKNEMTDLAVRMLNSTAEDGLYHMACKNLYKFDFLKSNFIRFYSEREYLAEDMLFLLDCLQYCSVLTYCEFPGYVYYDNDGSLTTGYRPNRFELLLNLNAQVILRQNILCISDQDMKRFYLNFLIVTLRCISQEVRNKKDKRSQAIAYIKSICDNKQVQNYIDLIDVHFFSSFNNLVFMLIKKKSYLLIYVIFYLYNKRKRYA